VPVDWREVFQPPEVYAIYGPPASGKSNLAIALAMEEEAVGRGVRYIITEPNLKPIADRIPGSQLALTIGSLEAIIRGVGSLDDATLIIDSLGEVYERVYRQARLEGVPMLQARVEAIVTVRDLVGLLTDVWASSSNAKLVFVTHGSPAIKDSFFGYPWPKPQSIIKRLSTVIHTRCVSKPRVVDNEGDYTYRFERRCMGIVVMSRYREIEDAVFEIPTPRL
jgi:hypothetical protein